jgi:hypothetical protein
MSSTVSVCETSPSSLVDFNIAFFRNSNASLNCSSFCLFSDIKAYKTTKDAVMNFMINQAFLEEPEHKENFCDTVLGVFDLKFKL